MKIFRYYIFITIVNVSTILNAQKCFEKTIDNAGGFGMMQFVSNNVGYCSATNFQTILKTDNAGKTWEELVNYTDFPAGNEFYFVNESLAFLYGKSVILRTSDQGITFTAPVQNNNYTFRELFFLTDSVGYAISYPGNLWKTTDSGLNWSVIYDFPLGLRPGVGDQLYFFNESRGIILRGSTLIQTSNGGLSWNEDRSIIAAFDYHKMGNKLIILTRDELITYSSEGVINSREKHFFHPFGPHGSYVTKPNFILTSEGKGYYTSGVGISYTKDYGINWSQISDADTEDVFINNEGKGAFYGVYYSGDLYYYDCPLGQHSGDIYDRCYFAYTFDSTIDTSFRANSDQSRTQDSYPDNFKIPIPSCWTNSTRLIRPYWFHFKGGNREVSLRLNRNSLSGVDACKASLYKGTCHDLEIVDCGQIDRFSDKIEFELFAQKGTDYFLVIDPNNYWSNFAFELQVNGGSTTSLDYNQALEFSIYPNPISESFYIKSKDRIHGITIFSMDGRKVWQKEFTDDSLSESVINVESLSKGIYFVLVTTRNWSGMRKLVKQ